MHTRKCTHIYEHMTGGPAGVEAAFSDLRPTLALQYPFELDTFQKEAVVQLERNNSVRFMIYDS